MPFGLVNAPATFQRLMETLFGDLHWQGVLIYLDDILIHAETQEEALKLLDIVMTRLEEANLTIKLKKCSFFPSEIEYLGHVIDQDGIRPNLKRIQALKNLEAPSDVTGVRRILGLFGYYRDYIPRFAEIAEPLVECLRGKKITFTWPEDRENALQALKPVGTSNDCTDLE